MTASSKDTMETLARLLDKGSVGGSEALKTAYQLGKFDGLIEMAQVSADKAKQLAEAA